MGVKQLSIKNIIKQYQQGDMVIPVLNGISMSFQRGKKYGIMGISGTGKSTLLHLIAGLETPTSGSVWYDQQEISKLGPSEKALFLNRSIGLVFQYPYLIKELSVLENVMVPGLIAGVTFEQCQQRALFLLEQVGLEIYHQSQPSLLSGGQQQRVALARALCNEPSFLLADEPTANLDEKTGNKVIELLLACQEKWDMGIIISSHDRYIIDAMEETYHLTNGLLTCNDSRDLSTQKEEKEYQWLSS